MPKTKLEIISETVEFYGADPSRRAKSPTGLCRYFMGDGRRCAVGRCMLPLENLSEKSRITIDRSPAADEFPGVFDEYLQPEYRGHDTGFWRLLQMWHDRSGNFTPTGISEEGKDNVAQLVEMYGKEPA